MAVICHPRRNTKLLLVIGAGILILVLMQSFIPLQIWSVDVDTDTSEQARETLQNMSVIDDASGSDGTGTSNIQKDTKSVNLDGEKKVEIISSNSSPSKTNDEKKAGEKDVDQANNNEKDFEKEKEKPVPGEADAAKNNDNDDKIENNKIHDNNQNNGDQESNNNVKSDNEARALLADTELVARKLQSNCTFYKDVKPIDLQKTLETMRFYVKNEKICRDPGDMLIYIHSGASHFERRQAIRETWGKKEHLRTLNATMIFITGYTKEKPILKGLRQEIRQHRDIVVAGFIDSYFNMTLKALTAMKWAMTYCSNRHYILKLDDDIFVGLTQMKKLIDYLKIFYSPDDTLVACSRWEDAPVMRSGSEKWCITEYEFPLKVFPPYCAGAAVLYNNLTLETLYQVASKMSYFWIDDVFITGILTQQLGINIRPLNKYCALFDHEISRRTKDKTETDVLFYHTLKSSIMHLLWRLYAQRYGLG